MPWDYLNRCLLFSTILCGAIAAGKSNLTKLARHFDGQICRSALAAENTSRWQRLCDPVSDLCRYPGTQDAIKGSRGSLVGITYVRNQKVGSDMLFSGFPGLFGVTNATKCHIGEVAPNVPRRGPWQGEPCFPGGDLARDPQGSFVFTIVRDPARTALSAYLELRFRARYRNRGRLAFQELGGGDNEKGDRSCGGPTEATNQFIAYLQALERGMTLLGQNLGRDAYHAWPQALKLDRMSPVNPKPTAEYDSQEQNKMMHGKHGKASRRGAKAQPRRYDAIGRLEFIGNDIDEMRAIIAMAIGARANQSGYNADQDSSPLDNRRHSHAAASCAEVDLTSPEVARLLCRLYSSDYACFGYVKPQACENEDP